jgi:RNA polymerase sigma factor (sigma-70 family)
MPMPLAQPPPQQLDDHTLAQRALAGDGRAFAALYDRHERRIYGFCLRLLGGSHDAADATQETFVRILARLPSLQGRELNFIAYALTAARNACYDTIEGRRRAEPVSDRPERPTTGEALGDAGAEVTLDPERTALLSSAREDVRAANAALPARQREVLALREIELLSYDEIGAIMGLNRNAVAQLVSRARIKLRDLLRGAALASVSASSPDCTRALPLLAQLQDGEQGAPAAELHWLQAHLAGCDTCRLGRAAMEEAGVSYRALAPVVPLVWLRHATIARAADFVGADWSDVAGLRPQHSGGEGGRSTGQPSQPGGESLPSDGQSSRSGGGSSQSGGPPQSGGPSQSGGEPPLPDSRPSRRRRAIAAGVLGLCLLLGAIFGLTRDSHAKHHASAVLPAASGALTAVTTTTSTSATTTTPHRKRPAATAARTHSQLTPHTTTTTHTSAGAPASPQPAVRHAPHHARTHHRHEPPRKQPPVKAPASPPRTTSTSSTPAPTTTTALTTAAPTPPSTTTTQATSTTASTTTTSSSETTARETIPGGGPTP